MKPEQQLLEVRCCCEPEKLRGWLAVDPTQREHFFALKPDRLPRAALPEEALQVPEQIILKQDLFYPGPNVREYFALKAESIPGEKLLRIPGFIPAKESA